MFFDSPELQSITAQTYVKEKYSDKNDLITVLDKQPDKKIRIGYYSADFRNHAMSFLFANLFELHDKSAFEIYGFSFIPGKGDKMHSRISNTFDKFIDVKLKNEMGVDSRDYWKTTHKALRTISERLVKLANKVGKMY